MAAFCAGPDVAAVIASGPAKTSIRTTAGLQADLRVVPLDAWGAALQYFTGSQAHNIAVRQIAVRRKLRLSEYGLFDTGDRGADRLAYRGGGLRPAGAGLDTARDARGSRRGRGGGPG